MPLQPKMLLLDDDQNFLNLYQEMLSRHLPSLPDVKVANSGARALSMLEADSFNLLSVDLNMPKMDGLQVLSIARRKYPQLRLVVLTGIRDEQFRARAYAMGVDQYWIKPESDQEMGLLMESFESLLNQEAEGGFRGIQSKSMVDIIQLECLSQSTSLLRITNGRQEGRIHIRQGEVIDAETEDLHAEAAFQRILTWKSGAFEILPADADRPRTILASYQGLLLDTAQAMDEAASQFGGEISIAQEPSAELASKTGPLIAELAQIPGIEFIIARNKNNKESLNYWGLEQPERTANWAQETLSSLQALGDFLRVGEVEQVMVTGPQNKITLASAGKTDLIVGMIPTLPSDHARDIMKSVLTKWAS